MQWPKPPEFLPWSLPWPLLLPVWALPRIEQWTSNSSSTFYCSVVIAFDLLNVLSITSAYPDRGNLTEYKWQYFRVHILLCGPLSGFHWPWDLPWHREATWSRYPVYADPRSSSLETIPWEENKLLTEAAWKFAAPNGIILWVCPSYCWPLSLLEPIFLCPTLHPSSKCYHCVLPFSRVCMPVVLLVLIGHLRNFSRKMKCEPLLGCLIRICRNERSHF